MNTGIHLLVEGHTLMRFTQPYLVRFQEDLVEAVGMRVIHGPNVVGGPKNWYGITILAESHTTLHVAGDTVWLDLFSCTWYDHKPALELMINRLKLTSVNHHVIKRKMPSPIGVT